MENSSHLSRRTRREEAPCMLKNMYVSKHLAWYSLLMAALFIVLVACGGDSNTTTAIPTPTNVSTTIVSTTNTPSAPPPTSTSPGSTQPSSRSVPTSTPTPPRPTPTPTVSRP